MRVKHFRPGKPYFLSEVVFALHDNNQYDPLYQLYFPFEPSLWLCIATTLLISLVVIGCIHFFTNPIVQNFVFGHRTGVPILNLIRIYLGVSIGTLPSGTFARTLLAIWTITCFVLQNSYQGSLFKFMKTPKTIPPPKTIVDLINENYTIYNQPFMEYVFDDLPQVHKL